MQYVIDSYKLGSVVWTETDLQCFTNALKYIIWQDRLNPSDNVDGTYKIGLSTSGWKQSDGWMKLTNVLNDKELFDICDAFNKNNINNINKNYPYIQFLANMTKFQSNN